MSAKQRDKNVPLTGSDTVVGLFREQSEAERAIRRLQSAGFADDQIGILMRDRDRQQELAESTGTTVEEGAAAGAVGGGLVGGTLGLLAGVGALVIPGIGPIVAAGTIASTLAGAGIGAAAGGLLGALVGMGIPEEEARHFERGVQTGGILVTVRAGARAAEAREILSREGAEFGRAATGASSGFAAGAGRDVDAATAEGGERLELREEVLRAEKERVEAGEVRVRKDVVNEERAIDVPVTREEVVIERRPAAGGRPASGDIAADGEEIRIPVVEEEVRVEKTPVVKEEITVRKRQVQDVERVTDTVRREEARVDTSGDTNVRETGRTGGSWRGSERRYRNDPQYTGPDRRMSTV
jgi:uncharacterized protein (TIGR02271 family)